MSASRTILHRHGGTGLGYLRLTPLLAVLCFNNSWSAQAGINFRGTLVEEPCTVATGTEGTDIDVDFGTLTDKDFYTDGPVGQRAFHILLEDCDPTLAATAKLTFKGAEETDLPGMLALSSGPMVNSVAIGLAKSDGTPVPLNQQITAKALTPGNNQLDFIAYLQATDSVVQQQNVTPGKFTALATFILEYE